MHLMKTKLICSFQILAAFALVVLVFVAASCSKREDGHGHDPNVDYYTCPMHPTVKSQDPNGKCPVCNMKLIPVDKKSGNTHAPTAPHQGPVTLALTLPAVCRFFTVT